MPACESVATCGLGAMVCWLLQLCLSCAGLAVSCCIMGVTLRSAKARFCMLVATLVLMMGYVWSGILLAGLHPFVSLAVLLSLLVCWGTGRLLLSWFPVLGEASCGFLEHPRRRRLPRDLRKHCKRAAKHQRTRSFQLGSRCLFFLQIGRAHV